MEKIFGGDTVVPDLPKTVMNQNYNPYGPQREDPTITLGYDLASWLQQVMTNNPKQEKFKALANFLGISIPFCSNRYSKNMEFACEKQSMGRDNDKFLEKHIKQVFKRWQKRWLVVGYNNIFYYEHAEDPAYAIRDNILFDNDTSFSILHIGRTHVEALFDMSRRKLKISIDGTVNGIICLHYVIKAFLKSPYTKVNRFTSFAPVREGNDCMLFADGIGYYKELYSALNKAEQDIMITDWWLSPEMPLIRPIKGDIETEESRVDFTLQRAAKRGVKVHILIYREFSLGLNTDSEHSEKRLESMHPNIRVMRHPSVIISLWSHHEKMCIVDKRKVFMGGLDLCWNRMDGNNHPLFNNEEGTLFPAVDFGNPLRKDIVRGREYKTSMLSAKDPRMPWHDVAAMLVGKICNDFVIHFSAYWNHAKETNYEAETIEVKKYNKIPLDENGEYHVQAPIQDRFIDEDTTIKHYLPHQAFNPMGGAPGPVVNPLMNWQGVNDPNIASNPFAALAAGSTSATRPNDPSVFENMRREFERQKQFNDGLPKVNSYNISSLEDVYASVPRSYLQNNFRPSQPPGLPNPYQPQFGTAGFTPGGPNPYAMNQAQPTPYGGSSQPKKSKNPFDVFSHKHREGKDTFEDFNIFMRGNMEQDSTNWQTWLRNNPGAIQTDQNTQPILQNFMKAFNQVSNQKKVVKINRFLEDRDEQSR